MSKSNGKADIPTEEMSKEAPEQELPPADFNDGFIEQGESKPEGFAKKEPTAQPPKVEAPSEPARDTELQRLRSERDSLLDRLARLQAEFDNYRKRSAKENSDFREYAVADSVKVVLPIVDSLSLALKNAEVHPEDFKKGVELIYKQFQDALQKLNVQRVPALGQPFDPRLHEAIEMVESDEAEDNHVLDELQAGYKIKDRLLRPAMVRVAKRGKK
ncbi:MAG TPA: nucleotide exchange factor GrpE [Candidatus Angelobacter sp.]|nr:nucleotide exchange factor GrpE [Candidatus Angelobacter sp.]